MSTTPASTASISSVEKTASITARSVVASSRAPMCTSHTLSGADRGTGPIAPHPARRLYHWPMAIETSPTPDQLRADLEAQGVEFVFAQFVDMHGKPNAKLVPVGHLEGLFADGAGFAGFAAGDIGQGPHDPDIAAMPDPATLTPLPWKPEIARFACDVTVEGEPWPYCPRTILRNQLARAKALGYDFKVGAELEYFLIRRRPDGGIELADELDTSDQPCYDMRALTRVARLRDRRRAARERARVGPVRDRPRGRERPVRAELHLRRRARHLRPGDLLPLHGRVDRAGARADRHVHAQAVREPDGQRLPLPHEPVGGRPQRDGDRPGGRPARAGADQGGLPLHRRPDGARAGLHRRDRADGQLLQAPEGGRPALGRDVGARLRLLRLQQPHADAARAGAGPGRGPHGRRLLQPVPRRDRAARRRARRDRARARVPRPEPDEPLRVDPRAAARRSASTRCRRTCSTRRASSSATT